MRSFSPTVAGLPGCAASLSVTSSASTCSVFTTGAASAGPARASTIATVRWRPMLWVKAFHIVFVVSWFAGLFYLPRLFVYHALAGDNISKDMFKVMERKLYRGIMTPTMVLTLATGGWMWLGYGVTGGWLHVKV